MSSVVLTPASVRTPSKARILGILRPFDAVAAISLWTLVLLQHGMFWNGIAAVAACVGCVRAVRQSGWFWIAVAAALSGPVCWQWQAHEDHVYFAILWIAAIGISRFGVHRRRSLMASGRLLIALAMGFAVLWKAISGQYLSSEMFHHRMLTDARFRTIIAEPIAGLTADAIEGNRAAIERLRGTDGPATVQLGTTRMLGVIALFMTAWTIAIELLIAIAFVVSNGGLLDRLRNPLLLLFMVSTYVVVPVVGFGMLFAAMGMAQCRRSERKWQLAYFLFAGLLTVYAGLGYDHLV